MANLKDLPIGRRAPELVFAVIEIPRGTRAKYEYDVNLGVFRLDRLLYASMFYPTAYGFIPGTLAPDGDPLDILVMISEPLAMGVMVEARPLGVLRMEDEKGQDNKILAVATGDPAYRAATDLRNVSHDELRLIEHFFMSYKTLEHKHVTSQGWAGRAAAHAAVNAGRRRYLRERKPGAAAR
ncbi:MAG TPA: inorganic diphosphatase [Terriglobales bacterium]|nr:inorganic diphosphatase [Terriglobales bacterium]